ncbi:transposase [Flavobacterium sp. GT3P67]|uniref:transposase n=1 Tax=Flavobacterium sp. GT3P67 TaxID=2541722 RepID=UPI001048EF75|nr:transposase [Flavobacterium sp. GT3P67]TDE49864.1 transposase [Flavobacterium sp. GT3P67]
MPLFKNRYQTESNRLKNWDYSSEAIYFVTLVAQNRECIFGVIDDDKIILNDNGKIIETELLKSITIRECWFFHNWVIMPNHIHLLVEIVSSSVETHNVETYDLETHCSASLQLESESHSESKPQKLSRKPNSISSFVAIFKSVTTKQINVMMNYDANIIWQSNYHDHIVRNYNSFDTIYHYIKNNPKNWNTDSINSNLE